MAILPDDAEYQNQVSGSSGNGEIYAEPEWPDFVRPATVHTNAKSWRDDEYSSLVDNARMQTVVSLPDHTVGGKPGLVDTNPYTLGTVDTNRMEKYEMRGRQVRIRRRAERSRGPVGTSDQMSSVAIAIANAGGPGVSREQIAASLMRGSF